MLLRLNGFPRRKHAAHMGPLGIALLDTQTAFEELKEGDLIVFSTGLPKTLIEVPNQTKMRAHRIILIDKKQAQSQPWVTTTKKQKECEIEVHDQNGNLIDTLKEECQQLYLENVKKNQCLGKVVWWTTIILWRRIV